MTSQQKRLHLAAILFFAGLAFITLYPLLTHTGTHTAGYDFFAYNWNFWWTRHALTQPDLTLFESNFIMFPAMTNYGFHTLTLFWFPLWACLEPLIGTLAAVNSILFLGCFLNGYLLFVFLRSEKIAAPLALLSGAALQVLPISRYFYYNTHLNLMDWFWLPVHLLLWKQVVRAVEAQNTQKAFLWAGIQGVGLWGVAHTDLQFPIFVTFLLAPYALLTLWHSRQRLRLLMVGILTVGLSVALFWVAGPLPYMLRFSGTRVISPVEERPGIAFPGGFLSMSETWWEWHSPTVGSFVTVCFLLTLGYSLFRQFSPKNDRWFWFVIMLPPLIFSLGADLKIGTTTIPMPYRLFYDLTDGMFRMPWRLAPVFLTAAAVFVGKSWRLPASVLTKTYLYGGLFLFLAVSIRLFETAPLQPLLYPYQFYESIGQEQGEYGIVEIPTGAGTGEVLLGDPRAIQFQFYGITHEKRMVNGFLARAPLDHYWYLQQDDPMLAWLGQRRPLEPALVRDQLRERIFNWTIGYFVLHQDYVRANGGSPEEIIGFFNAQPDLLCPWVVEQEAVVYRTRSHPGGCPKRIPPEIAPDEYQIDIGARGDEKFIGWGWHWAENVGGVSLRWAGDQPQTWLYFDLPPGEYELTLAAQAFRENRQLTLFINDKPLPENALIEVESLKTYTFTLSSEVVGDGNNLALALVYDGWHTPMEVLENSQDPRKLAIAVDWLRFKRLQ